MKCLLKLVVMFVLVLVLGVVGLGFLLDPAAEQAVSKGLTAATGCTSSLGAADVGLLSGGVRFERLEVQNPPGFRAEPLLSMGALGVNWDTASLLSDEVQVKDVELSDLVLSLELKGGESNVKPVIDRLRQLSQSSGGGADEPGGPAPEGGGDSGGGGKKVNIEQVRVSGVRTDLHVTGVPGVEGDYSVSVPAFVIEDLGNGENSATLGEWSARILQVTLQKVQEAGAGTFPGEWQTLLTGNLDALKQGALDALKDEAQKQLEGQLENLPEDVKSGIDALKKKSGGLGGLLGGDDKQ
ncbi:MAG: hypothetical protein H6828_14430 [Planctomycetes bacterium]|nr:hypothetical protein [Planctomycetota bacterium]